MKTCRKLLLWVFALAMVVCNTQCTTATQNTNDTPADKEINGIAFDQLSLSSIFKAEIRQSDEYKVKISVPERLKKYLVADIKNKKLIIGMKEIEKGLISSDDDENMLIEIFTPNLTKVKLCGTVRLTMNGNWALDEASFNLSRASVLKGNYIQANTLKIEQTGASIVRIDAAVDKLDINNTGASILRIRSSDRFAGSHLKLHGDGASKINVSELPFNTIETKLSGAAKASVYALKNLTAETSGASSLHYINESKELKKHLNREGASSIKSLEISEDYR